MIPASEERKAGPGSEGGGSDGRWDARKDTDDVSQRRTSDPPGGLFDVCLDDAPSSPPAGDLSAPHTRQAEEGEGRPEEESLPTHSHSPQAQEEHGQRPGEEEDERAQ